MLVVQLQRFPGFLLAVIGSDFVPDLDNSSVDVFVSAGAECDILGAVGEFSLPDGTGAVFAFCHINNPCLSGAFVIP